MVRGVILDVDGTLIDSNDAHARAFAEAFAACGHPVPYEQIRALIGMGSDKLIEAASGIPGDSPAGREILRHKKAIFEARYLPTLRAFPGVHRLLDALRERGLKLAVASSAQGDELGKLLKVAGAESLKAKATGASGDERSKPDPDTVEAALETLGVPPEEAVMIGDTPYDIEAAARAGVRTIALLTGGWTPEALHDAAAIYRDPAELLDQLPASPLSR